MLGGRKWDFGSKGREGENTEVPIIIGSWISKGERGREGVSQAEEAKVMDVERIQNNRGGRGFWRRGEASGAALRGCQNRLVRLRREEDDSMEK